MTHLRLAKPDAIHSQKKIINVRMRAMYGGADDGGAVFSSLALFSSSSKIMLRLGISIIGRTSLPLLSWYYVFCWLLHTIHVDSSSREKTIEWGSHTPLGTAAVARPFSSQFSSSSSTDNSHIVNSNFPAWATMLPGPLCCVPRAQPSSHGKHGKHMADSNKCWLPTAKNLGVVGWRTGYLTSRISLPLTPCNKYTESRWMAAVHIASRTAM